MEENLDNFLIYNDKFISSISFTTSTRKLVEKCLK